MNHVFASLPFMTSREAAPTDRKQMAGSMFGASYLADKIVPATFTVDLVLLQLGALIKAIKKYVNLACQLPFKLPRDAALKWLTRHFV